MTTYAVGHKIPDTDSIVGAIAIAYLKNQLGEEVIPSRLGNISPETRYVLDRFGLEEPELKMSYAGDAMYIVDHSDIELAPDDVDQATVLGIIDHHKLGDLTTTTPLECWIRPVGCSNTVIREMYAYHGVDIPKNIAGAMMCAILSDTVIFKSPTCTPVDIKVVNELAEIAGIDDPQAVGLELFNVKSAVAGTPMRDLVMRDFKDFNMSGNKVGIGQLEVVDLSIFDDIKAGLEADIAKLREEGERHSVFLLLTDIMQEGSEILVASTDGSVVERAFDITLSDNKAWLAGVLSRKKQVVPNLESAFA